MKPPSAGIPIEDSPPISYAIMNFNGRDCLPQTLQAVYRHGYNVDEVIVVDDGSTDGSVQWLAREWPQVTVVALEKNCTNPCVVRNLGLRRARNRIAFLMDNDITLQPGCVQALLQAMRAMPDTLCATPRLLDADDPGLIYADGNSLHFLGLSCRPARRQRVQDCPARQPFDTFASGIMLIDMTQAQQVGLFDEGYLRGWGNDAEFQLRGRMFGLHSLHVCAAVCLHKGKQHGARRAYGQMHNRYRLLLTVFRARTLLLLAPSLILFELLLAVGAVVKGFAADYAAAVASIWRERASWRAARRRIQGRRVVDDAGLMQAGAFEMPGALPDRAAVRWASDALAALFGLNWQLVKRWI